MQKFKVNGQSVPKIEWKQTDGGECITSRANEVGNKSSAAAVIADLGLNSKYNTPTDPLVAHKLIRCESLDTGLVDSLQHLISGELLPYHGQIRRQSMDDTSLHVLNKNTAYTHTAHRDSQLTVLA